MVPRFSAIKGPEAAGTDPGPVPDPASAGRVRVRVRAVMLKRGGLNAAVWGVGPPE